LGLFVRELEYKSLWLSVKSLLTVSTTVFEWLYVLTIINWFDSGHWQSREVERVFHTGQVDVLLEEQKLCLESVARDSPTTHIYSNGARISDLGKAALYANTFFHFIIFVVDEHENVLDPRDKDWCETQAYVVRRAPLHFQHTLLELHQLRPVAVKCENFPDWVRISV
jgi:hypothetical protein